MNGTRNQAFRSQTVMPCSIRRLSDNVLRFPPGQRHRTTSRRIRGRPARRAGPGRWLWHSSEGNCAHARTISTGRRMKGCMVRLLFDVIPADREPGPQRAPADDLRSECLEEDRTAEDTQDDEGRKPERDVDLPQARRHDHRCCGRYGLIEENPAQRGSRPGERQDRQREHERRIKQALPDESANSASIRCRPNGRRCRRMTCQVPLYQRRIWPRYPWICRGIWVKVTAAAAYRTVPSRRR